MTPTGVSGRWSSAWNSMPSTVWLLSVISFFVAAGYGVIVPVLPVYASSFGVGLFEVGVVIGVFALSRVILSPFVPRMISKFGTRTMITAGQYITAISYALMGLSQSYEQLVLFRFLGGFGSVMFTISSMSLLVVVAPATKRARALGIWQGGFLLGNMLGPALGGLLAVISLTAPFFFYAVSVAVAGTVSLIFLRNVSRRPASEDKPGIVAAPSFRTVLRDRGFQAALTTNFAQGWAVTGVRTTLVPVIITTIMLRDPVWTGIAFAIGSVVQTLSLFPVARFIDTAGRRLGIIIGTVLCAAATMGLAVAPNLWLLTLSLAVMGLGAVFTGTAPAAAVADAAGSRASRPIAVYSVMHDLGQIIGPAVAGLLWDHTTPELAFGVGAGLMLLGMLGGLRMTRGR